MNYRDRTEEDEKLDYQNEKMEGKEEHKTEHPNSSYQAANQHMVKFKDELKAINEKTAMDYDFRKNPAEYNLEERKEALEAVEHAFNKTPVEQQRGTLDCRRGHCPKLLPTDVPPD